MGVYKPKRNWMQNEKRREKENQTKNLFRRKVDREVWIQIAQDANIHHTHKKE